MVFPDARVDSKKLASPYRCKSGQATAKKPPNIAQPVTIDTMAAHRGHRGRHAVPHWSQTRLPNAWKPEALNSRLVTWVLRLRQAGHCVWSFMVLAPRTQLLWFECRESICGRCRSAQGSWWDFQTQDAQLLLQVVHDAWRRKADAQSQEFIPSDHTRDLSGR